LTELGWKPDMDFFVAIFEPRAWELNAWGESGASLQTTSSMSARDMMMTNKHNKRRGREKGVPKEKRKT
jgi:hypothetical protein